MMYKNGEYIKVNVTDIKPYGAFVSLDNNYSGLIHISEISDGYVRNITDFINVGDTLDAKIMDINDEKHQLKLSVKDTLSKGKRMKIKETKNGFQPLKDHLNGWVEEKLADINNINE